MAMISACAVGSRSARVQLPARAKTSPPRTTTQPTGTSPRAPAPRASCRAMSMNDAISPEQSILPDLSGPRLCSQRCIRTRLPGTSPGMTQWMSMTDNSAHDHKSGERIAKVIARAGLASRRQVEDWIAAGRVTVNDAVINSPALNVTDHDRISVDGNPLPARERTRLFLYHKPRNLLT